MPDQGEVAPAPVEPALQRAADANAVTGSDPAPDVPVVPPTEMTSVAAAAAAAAAVAVAVPLGEMTAHLLALASAMKEMLARLDSLSAEVRGVASGVREEIAEVRTGIGPSVSAHTSPTRWRR